MRSSMPVEIGTRRLLLPRRQRRRWLSERSESRSARTRLVRAQKEGLS
jgi:hypothetical protein